ncbi:MAG: alpha/beta hydrolase [Bdellovibrionota bacterium]
MVLSNTQKSFKEVSFFSKGLKLHGRYFPALGVSKGNFLLLHGLTSNSAWFSTLAQGLSSLGYNVLVYDRRGSGLSGGVRGDVPSKEAFFWDLRAAADFVFNQSSQPLHVMAFSYSWKLSPIFIKKLQGESRKIESLIFVAPASDVRENLKPRVKDVLKILFNWKGPYFESPVKDSHLTQEAQTLEFIQNSTESRAQRLFTRRFLLASKTLDSKAAAILPDIKKPMLVIIPKDDQVIDAEKVKKRFEKAPVGFPRKIINVDGGHLLDSPAAQTQLLEKIMQWVSRPTLMN